ncbi:MAG: amidase [Pseudomonadota bacterium]
MSTIDPNSARGICAALQAGELSCESFMRTTYARINEVNPQVNAIVNLLDEGQAIALAKQADQIPVADRGPLHGLPMATKDAVDTVGFPTTWGFEPWKDRHPKEDDGQTQRLRGAGAIFIGHTNMPEFGLGSNTFNSLFGATRNPYDLSRTAGGSSGGAAVALATGMLPLADGSDMGGSLRNPASFCNVVGFRPSIGRVPNGRGFGWACRLATTGPMAKSVADLALLFSVQAGPDSSDPLTLPESGDYFLDAYEPFADLTGLKVAYCPNLHGIPIDPEVTQVLEQCAATFATLGAQLDQTGPDLADAMDVFQTQRAQGLAVVANALDATIPDWKQHAKDTAVWNMEKGQALALKEVIDAEVKRTQIYAHVAEFFAEYDALLLPAAQVPPFDLNQEWVDEIDGTRMETYIDWMTVCCAITVTGLPAISIPGGFTPDGLPVGLQIVGKPRGDLDLLRIAHTFEQATKHGRRKPQIFAGQH